MKWTRHLVFAALVGLFVQGAVQVAVGSGPQGSSTDVAPLGPGAALYVVEGAGEQGWLRINVTGDGIGPSGGAGLHVHWYMASLDAHGGLRDMPGGALVAEGSVYASGSDAAHGIRQTAFTQGTLPCGILILDTPTCVSPEGESQQPPGRWDGASWLRGQVRSTFRDDTPFADTVTIQGSHVWRLRLAAIGAVADEGAPVQVPALQQGTAAHGIGDGHLDGFTMQAAWQAALDSPTWPFLQSYLRDHDAHMTAATPWLEGWRFEVGGPHGRATFTATPPTPGMEALGPHFNGWHEDDRARPTMPALADLPSLLARASAWTEDPLHRAWFRAACAASCDQAEITYIVAGDDAQVQMDGEGRPASVTEDGGPHPAVRLHAVQNLPVGMSTQAAAGTGLAAAFAYLATVALKAPASALFSRVTKATALRHPLRTAIRDAVEAEPGIHVEELRRRLGLATGQIQHHLDILLREGIVREHRSGRIRHLYAADAAPQIRPPSPGARQIMAALTGGATTRAELARATDLHPSTVSYHLQRLADTGFVVRDGQRWAAA